MAPPLRLAALSWVAACAAAWLAPHGHVPEAPSGARGRRLLTADECRPNPEGATDSEGYNCESYVGYEDECGFFDDDDFEADRCPECNAALAACGKKSLEEALAGLPGNSTEIRLRGQSLVGTLPADLAQRFPGLEVLDLAENDLEGELPAAWGNLTKLEWLDLEGNGKVKGRIPESVGQWGELQHLNLRLTLVSGPIPEAVAAWRELRHLDLRSAKLTGRIPAAVGSWSKVEFVHLKGNGLEGEIPHTIGSWSKVTHVDFAQNHLEGEIPEAVGGWRELNYVDLSTNQLTGPIPKAVSAWSKVTRVFMEKNELAGPIPDSVGNWTELSEVHLWSNKLTGPIPKAVSAWSKVIHVYLRQNELAGPIPDSVGKWTELTELDLSYNRLTGPIPDAVGSWWKVGWLHLNSNELSGAIPEAVGKWSEVRSVYLDDNWLTGPIPEAVSKWSLLQEVWLGPNELTGSFPSFLANWTEVWRVALWKNKLNGSLPEGVFGSWPKLRELYLEDNEFSGPIPRDVGLLRELELAYMGSNFFSGPIPEEVGQWSKIEKVQLHTNWLTGSLPATLGNWSRLVVLSIFDNYLTGAIPEEVASWGQVEVLDLAHNHFTGSLPSAVGQWKNLREFKCEHCGLSGELPVEVGQWRKLRELFLGQNNFTGRIPAAVGNWSQAKEMEMWNNSFSGELPAEVGQMKALQRLGLSLNCLQGGLPDLGLLKKLTNLNLQGNKIVSTGLLPPNLEILDLSQNRLKKLPEALYELQRLKVLLVQDNFIESWPLRGVLWNKMLAVGVVECGTHPEEPRFSLPKLTRLDASRNAMVHTEARHFLSSLAYLHTLTDLACRDCQLGGLLHEEMRPGLADDQPHTGDIACSGAALAEEGFQGLLSLDLSGNRITELLAAPSMNLLTVDISRNALVKLDLAWFNLQEENRVIKLQVQGNPGLQLPVQPPASRCDTSGSKALAGDPDAYVATGEGHECTKLCPGVRTRYSTEHGLNVSALCRCLPGFAGQGQSCSACPADSYSAPRDRHGLVRECRPCPDGSTTGGVKRSTSVATCRCPLGTFLNESAVACAHCPQWPFRSTRKSGETQVAACSCNASYDGLKEADGLCGCVDGFYMNHRARKCSKCSSAEHCIWGTEIARSLRPPAVKAGFWPEPVADVASFEQNSIWRCSRGESCLDEGVCAENRRGRACGLCEPRTHGSPEDPCEECSEGISPTRQRWLLAAGALAGGIPTVLLLHICLVSDSEQLGLWMHLRAVRGSIEQTVRHLQTVSVIGSFGVSWPSLAAAFFNVLDQFTVKVPTLLGVGCLEEESSATLEMTFKWVLPLVLVVVTLLAVPTSWGLAKAVRLLSWAARGTCLGRRLPKVETCRMGLADASRVLLFSILLFWSTLTANSLEMLTCMPSPNGELTVMTHPHIRCSRDDGEFVQLAVLSVVSAIFYLLLPLFVVWRGYALSFYMLQDTECKDRGWHGFLFKDYRDGHMIWTILTLGKDALFVIIPACLPGFGAIQLLLTAAISALLVCLLVQEMPFRDRSNSLLEAWNSATAAAICIYSVGMGYDQTAGMEDVQERFEDGEADPIFQRRAAGMLAVECMAVVVPMAVLIYQLLCAFESSRRRLPKFVRPESSQERAQWIQGFCADAESIESVRGILKECDDPDYYVFRSFFEQTPATIGHKLSRHSRSSLVTSKSRLRTSSWLSMGSQGSQASTRWSGGSLANGLETKGSFRSSEGTSGAAAESEGTKGPAKSEEPDLGMGEDPVSEEAPEQKTRWI